jgi:hypothetical protein
VAEYTPKVWDDNVIREAFIDDGGLSEYHDPINGAQTHRRVMGDIFDRWLVAHDREVAAKALREAAALVYEDWSGGHAYEGVARQEVEDWLYARADRIESQANEKGADRG